MDLKTLLESDQSLARLAACQGVPAKTAYRLAKLLRQAESAKRDFHSARDAAVKRHGQEQAEKGRYNIPDENRPAFEAEINALLAEPVELSPCRIDPNELGGAEKTLAVSDYLILDWLIMEPESKQ